MQLKMTTTIEGVFQTINRPVIIKLLFPVLILLFSFTPKRTEKLNVPVIRKEVIIDSPFQSIDISGDISVILTNKPAGTVTIEGNESDVNNVRYRNKNNELIITAGRKKRFQQLTIYLSATKLNQMWVSGDGYVSSTGTIKTDNLHIWLNGDIKVKINTIGKISVDACDGYELVWKSALNRS